MNTSINIIEINNKKLEPNKVRELIMSEQDRINFEADLEWVIQTTTENMLQFRLEESYDLLENFFREWLNYLWNKIMNTVLTSKVFLEILKSYGAKLGYKYKEMREITIYSPGGGLCKVLTPYFLKAKKKRGKKKKGPNGRGCHLGLRMLGFIDRIAPNIGLKGIELCLLCPSFEFASKMLENDGIKLDGKQLSDLCNKVGKRVIENRAKYSFKEGESLKEKRVQITIDGGRVRVRRNKRGRRKDGQRGIGYYTDWREPKMFIIHILDNEGNINKKIAPYIDGAIGEEGEIKVEAFIELLKEYLAQLEIGRAEEVIVCGDGAPWIWERVPKLLMELGVASEKIFEIIDYTHAKQNLYEVFNKLPEDGKGKVSLKKWKSWLWKGDIERIKKDIVRVCKDSGHTALAKLKSYFEKNRDRMLYEKNREEKRPCGSGVIESAIRRVINLRLKSCGTFWKEGKIEIMLYLRSILLYGRWNVFYSNWLRFY